MKKFALLIVLSASLASFGSAQWNAYSGFTISDVTSVNGVPVVCGTSTTGTIGLFVFTGTDPSTRTYAPAAVHGVGTPSVTQVHNISWDGTRVNTCAEMITLDGTLRPSMAVWDIPTNTITPWGNSGWYASSGTVRAASTGWSFSGDGNTIGGQAFNRTTSYSSGASSTNFVSPSVATQAGGYNALQITTNNGRIEALNFDGTAAGGYAQGSADFKIWRKVAGIWQPGVSVIGSVGTQTNVTLGSVRATDATGRFWFGRFQVTGSGPRPVYQFDSTTGVATLFDVPATITGMGTNVWSGIPTATSASGDIVVGTFQTFPSLFIDLFRGFIWTPTRGMQLLNDFVDAQWPGQRVGDINNATSLSPDGDWLSGSTFGPASQILVRLGTPVRGNIALGDYIGDRKRSTLTWNLKDSGGNTVESWTGKLDDLGRWVNICKTSLGSSTWTLEVDGGSWLRKTVTFTAATKNTVNLTLQNGDVDNSGEVDAADIDAVIAKFGDVSTSPGFDPNTDVDGSNEVDAADIDVVIANFGAVNN